MASCPSLSASSEAFIPSELTPCSKMSTANRDEQIEFPKTGSVQVEIMVNLLKQARLQALNSIDMENKFKEVLYALIKSTINDFYSLPQERDKLPELLSRNAYVGLLCFLLWAVAFLMFSFYSFCYSRVTGSFIGLPPTSRVVLSLDNFIFLMLMQHPCADLLPITKLIWLREETKFCIISWWINGELVAITFDLNWSSFSSLSDICWRLLFNWSSFSGAV